MRQAELRLRCGRIIPGTGRGSCGPGPPGRRKTVGRQLAAAEVEKVRREIARHAEFTAAVEQIAEVNERICEARPAAGTQAPPVPEGEKGGSSTALAEARSAEIGRLAAEAARALGCDGGLGAAEAVLRAGLLKLGGSMLGQLLSADPGQRGPRLPCGQGHEAEFTDYRDKTSTPSSARSRCAVPGTAARNASTGSRRAMPSSAWPARPCPRAWPR